MRTIIITALLALLGLSAVTEEIKIKPGDRLCIVGDSITEAKKYCKFIEVYLTACYPELKTEVLQLGWSGEVAPSFFRRMRTDLEPFKPTVVTLYYGMNDGGCAAYNETTGKRYGDAMDAIAAKIVNEYHAALLIGSAGAVDTYYFKVNDCPPQVYNETLGKLSDIGKSIAAKYGAGYIDIHSYLAASMEKAKQKFGREYDVCGRDGIHPAQNGHLVIAYGFLKGLGFDGNIGSVVIDMNGGASVSEGQKVISSGNGSAEIESGKYPYCFTENSANSAKNMLPFIPFNEELNRFTLTVKNLAWEKAKVVWGGQEKVFSKQELSKGINLAAEFTENPFVQAFADVEKAVYAKQDYETNMIKKFTEMLPDELKAKSRMLKIFPAVEAYREENFRLQAKLSESVKARVVPVKHRIVVTKAE